MREWENERMREFGNEKMGEWENEEEEAARIALAEGLLVYSTLAKFETKTVRKIYKVLIFNYVFL